MAERSTVMEGDRRHELDGVTGWLILPAIGTFIAPLSYAWSLIETWRLMAGITIPRGLGAPIAIEMAASVISVLGWSWAIYLLVNKKAIYPKVFIALVLLNLTSAIIVAALLAGTRFSSASAAADIGRIAIPALVWIPYMLISRRVKKTFTHE